MSMMQDEKTTSEGGTGTAAPPAPTRAPKPTRTPPKPLPPWRVLLHNDDVNEAGYVVETIASLTPIRRGEAIQRMLEAHTKGIALLLVTHRERAELYAEQFMSKRLTVTIEPSD
ncbi:MAG: ATP-dependent Clp protease adaptor ClpS [Phycisphaerales bacterium]|nr:ATP-dependent Clp protease adaptor ClpS [Phycisphaerales bacterium]